MEQMCGLVLNWGEDSPLAKAERGVIYTRTRRRCPRCGVIRRMDVKRRHVCRSL